METRGIDERESIGRLLDRIAPGGGVALAVAVLRFALIRRNGSDVYERSRAIDACLGDDRTAIAVADEKQGTF